MAKQEAVSRNGPVIVLGCYPPRKCGIATFTKNTVDAIRAADPARAVSVIAMDDGAHANDGDPAIVHTIRQNDLESYKDAAAFINAMKPDALIIQHEFGIFGGPAGEHILTLLALVKAPVITICHTVLERPDHNQFKVMRRLILRSARLMVMAERGADMLCDVFGATRDRISVIPHGAPERAFSDPSAVREALGMECERMITTFGLLSPNKGIESMIRAMPGVLARFPSTRYMILGVTHPHILASHGETYRQSLEDLAARLGVAGNVEFINRYVDDAELLDYLQASDIYITPYLNEAQITSGTLSYALAVGCYVISTPYWHASEVFEHCPGSLVDYNDSEAICDNVVRLLADEGGLTVLRREVYDWAQHTLWPVFGSRIGELITDAVQSGTRIAHISERQGPAFPAISLKAIERMTDNCGIFQHSRFDIPDRRYGYCVDDNARALIMTNDLIRRGKLNANVERLHAVYAGFVMHAFDDQTGLFRNFMGYDRSWSSSAPSQDSQGRAFWALGHAAATSQYSGNVGWAATLLQDCLGQMREIASPRTKAFIILGCTEIMQSQYCSDVYADLMRTYADALAEQLINCRDDNWNWLEDTLSYDNARINQALLAAGRLSGSDRWTEAALSSLDWLCDIQLVDHGLFAPVGSDSFARVRQPPLPHDQQPVEAAAMLDACYEAFLATRNPKWWRRGKTVFSWFYGLNSHEQSLVEPVSGQCHDGLNRSGLNLNSGAESVLAFQMAVSTYQAFLVQIEGTPRREDELGRQAGQR